MSSTTTTAPTSTSVRSTTTTSATPTTSAVVTTTTPSPTTSAAVVTTTSAAVVTTTSPTSSIAPTTSTTPSSSVVAATTSLVTSSSVQNATTSLTSNTTSLLTTSTTSTTSSSTRLTSSSSSAIAYLTAAGDAASSSANNSSGLPPATIGAITGGVAGGLLVIFLLWKGWGWSKRRKDHRAARELGVGKGGEGGGGHWREKEPLPPPKDIALVGATYSSLPKHRRTPSTLSYSPHPGPPSQSHISPYALDSIMHLHQSPASPTYSDPSTRMPAPPLAAMDFDDRRGYYSARHRGEEFESPPAAMGREGGSERGTPAGSILNYDTGEPISYPPGLGQSPEFRPTTPESTDRPGTPASHPSSAALMASAFPPGGGSSQTLSVSGGGTSRSDSLSSSGEVPVAGGGNGEGGSAPASPRGHQLRISTRPSSLGYHPRSPIPAHASASVNSRSNSRYSLSSMTGPGRRVILEMPSPLAGDTRLDEYLPSGSVVGEFGGYLPPMGGGSRLSGRSSPAGSRYSRDLRDQR